MSYCPKCDMEFVDGITVCTDCGGPLVESEEVAIAMRKKEQEEAVLQKQKEYLEKLNEKMELQAALERAESGDLDLIEGLQPVGVYETNAQKYENLRSSASAFLIVGGILSVAAVLCWAGVVRLPMVGTSKYIFQGSLAVMAVFCLGVYVKSSRDAKNLQPEITREKQQISDLIDWFAGQWTAEDVDSQVEDRESLEEEELSLKRFQVIQDLLTTNKDLPDPAYVDLLCEEIYSRLYES